jgi:hypothetical protein
MRHIVTSFVAPVAAPHFSALSHKRHDFREKRYATGETKQIKIGKALK